MLVDYYTLFDTFCQSSTSTMSPNTATIYQSGTVFEVFLALNFSMRSLASASEVKYSTESILLPPTPFVFHKQNLTLEHKSPRL